VDVHRLELDERLRLLLARRRSASTDEEVRYWRAWRNQVAGHRPVLGSPWAVAGVVTAAALVLNAHTRTMTVDWQALTDARPEMEKLIAVEEHTSHLYDAAVAQFRLGTLSAERLARLIEMTLIPELQEMTLRIESLNQVRTEQQPLLVQAKQYLQLRSESWRLRA
jgi:predicted HTH domain antitoxin